MAFKLGAQGLGYYRDVRPTPSKASTARSAAPASAAGKAGGSPKWRELGGGLKVVDVATGRGTVATRGKKVAVKYAGTLTSGKRFDAGKIDFRLGGGEVIRGWDVGIAGMLVGGKRQLQIPPALAYGKRGSPPVIPPNATLNFDVELLHVGR